MSLKIDLNEWRVDIIHRYHTIRSTYAKPDEHQMVRFTLPSHPERAVVEGDLQLFRTLALECQADAQLHETYLRKILLLENRLRDALQRKSVQWAQGF